MAFPRRLGAESQLQSNPGGAEKYRNLRCRQGATPRSGETGSTSAARRSSSPICRSSIRMWDDPGNRYLLEDLLADVGSGVVLYPRSTTRTSKRYDHSEM
jgi:hypothetical protein